MHGAIRRPHLRWALALAGMLVVVATTASFAASQTTTGKATTEQGTLRFITSNPPTTFDPAHGPAFAGTFMDPVYEPLIRTDSRDNPTLPGLATKWRVQKNGILLTLRKGVRFSDGAAFDAKVLKANVARTKKAGGDSGAALAPVTGVKVINRYAVLLQTKGPRPELIYSLTTAAGQMVSPRAFNSPDLGRHPVGAGPYMLDMKETVPNSKYVYVKNPYYFDKQQQGVDRLVLLTIGDESQRINALKSGQGDAAMIGDGAEYRAYKAAGDLTVKMAPGGPLVFVVVTPTGPWANQAVRQALGFALDLDALENSVWKDFGRAANQVFTAGKLGYLPSPPFVFHYNVAKAKQLLESAGGPPPEFDLPTLPWKIDETQALLGYLNAAGFKAGMKVVQPQQQLPMIHSGKFPVAYVPLFEHDAAAFVNSLGPRGYLNPKGVRYPEIEKLASRAAAASVTNPRLSKQLYGTMMAKIVESGVVIPVSESSNGVAFTRKVKGMKAWPRWYTGTSLRGVRVTG